MPNSKDKSIRKDIATRLANTTKFIDIFTTNC